MESAAVVIILYAIMVVGKLREVSEVILTFNLNSKLVTQAC